MNLRTLLPFSALSLPALLLLTGGAIAQEDEWQVTLDNGLRWTDTVVGTGPEAGPDSKVTVHYEGWLRTGKKFDSSRERDTPFTFNLGTGRVIGGWEIGFAGMKEGGKRKLMIPSALAYGEQGAGNGVIPPGADLLFEIELLDVVVPPTQAELLKPAPGMSGELVEKKNGLGWIDLKVGSGETARNGRTVTMQYTGWLLDGTKFDSSRDRGKPFSFQLGAGRVIQGWDQGVLGMKVGGRRQLNIPAKLGYGKSGAGDDIPPNADLVFEVELIRVDGGN